MGACLPLLIEEINDISDKSNFLCPVSPWIGTPDFFVSPYIKLKRNSIGNRYPRTRFPGELCMEYRNPGPAWILYPLPTRRLYATTINSKHLCEGSRVLGKGDLFLCQRLGGKESLIPWQRVAECPCSIRASVYLLRTPQSDWLAKSLIVFAKKIIVSQIANPSCREEESRRLLRRQILLGDSADSSWVVRGLFVKCLRTLPGLLCFAARESAYIRNSTEKRKILGSPVP